MTAQRYSRSQEDMINHHIQKMMQASINNARIINGLGSDTPDFSNNIPLLVP